MTRGDHILYNISNYDKQGKTMQNEAIIRDIVIIGGGPAGLTAGLYAMRGGANTMLLESLFPGGQIIKTHKIENFPGRPDFPDGYALAESMASQAAAFGLETVYASADSVSAQNGLFTVETTEGTMAAKSVILCPGASPRPLGLAEEERFIGHGVSYCATCDGSFYRNKRVAVVGGGDTALNDALYLSALCEKVFLIHRRDAFRGSPVLEKAVRAKENIELVLSSRVISLQGEKSLSSLVLESTKTGEKSELAVNGLFVAVGIVPNTKAFANLVPLTPEGFIPTDVRRATEVPGLFAAGDACVTPLRQVITACADGAVAATSALEYLQA